jgi:hypothetical protein
MSWDMDLHIGLPTDDPQPCIKSADEMRQAIAKGRRDSALIHNVLTQAAFNGMSGEDTYVLLAYHALVEAERQWQHCMKFVRLNPMPPVIMSRQFGEKK